jgi:hypothetical protein
MKKIIAISQIITRQKINQIKIVTESGEQTVLGKFYKGVSEGQINTLEEAEAYLYEKPMNRVLMNKLKDNLYNRLINTTFFIDMRQPNFTDYQRAFHSLYKLYAAYILLCNKGLDKEAVIEIGDGLLKKAQLYDFSEIVIGVGNILSSTYALMGKLQKSQKLHDIINDSFEAQRLEITANGYFDDLIGEHTIKRAASNALSEKSWHYYQILQPNFSKYPTFRFAHFVFTFEMFTYGFINDYKNVMIVCDKAIAFFEKKGKGFNLAKIFYQHKIECCIYFGLYTEGVALQPKIQSFLVDGNHNWFKNQELLIKLCFHSGQYEEAYLVFRETTGHPKFKKLLGNYQEFWKVCEVYIYVCVALGLIKNLNAEEQRKKFRLSTFVNNVPSFSFDKRGMNIPIIIAQILYFLVKKDFISVLERIENIEKYCIRHLVDKYFDIRSYYFIKMLLTLPEADYNFKRVQTRSQGFKEKFESAPDNAKNIELEIMPYETIWGLLLDLIDSNLKNKKSREKHLQTNI